MPDLHQVRDLGFAFEVQRPKGDPATVIPLDFEARDLWCCDCALYECEHAVRVLRFLIDRENR